jgi:hypothetical protein
MNSVQDQHSIFSIQTLSVTEELDAKPAMVTPEHDPLEPTAGGQSTNADNDEDGGTSPNVKFWEEKICHGMSRCCDGSRASRLNLLFRDVPL